MKSIMSNWWQNVKSWARRTNWEKVGTATTALGNLSMGTAMIGQTIRDMNHGCGCNSIWTKGGYFGSPYGGGCDVMSMMMGGTSPYLSMYGQNAATMQGYMIAQQFMQQQALQRAEQQAAYQQYQTKPAPKTDNPAASAIDTNQNTNAGDAFNTATDAMVKDGNIVKDKEYTIATDGAGNNTDTYINAVSELGKIYGAVMDTDKDGYVSLNEFTTMEMKKMTNASEAEKSKAKEMAKIAFDKINLNGDDKVDWKELAAVMATLDSETTSGRYELDGKISSQDYAKWSALMAQQNTNAFDKMLRKNYKDLGFGKK